MEFSSNIFRCNTKKKKKGKAEYLNSYFLISNNKTYPIGIRQSAADSQPSAILSEVGAKEEAP
jgi:hypothetical protein